MKAQVSLEYLLMAVAVFALVIGGAAVIVMVLEEPTTQKDIQLDILECGNNHTWLKEYYRPYDGTDNAPGSISYYDGVVGSPVTYGGAEVITGYDVVCTLQNEFDLRMDSSKPRRFFLEKDGGWFVYEGGVTPPVGGGTVTHYIGSVGGEYVYWLDDYTPTNHDLDDEPTPEYWLTWTEFGASDFGELRVNLVSYSGPLTEAKICAWYLTNPPGGGDASHTVADPSPTASATPIPEPGTTPGRYYCADIGELDAIIYIITWSATTDGENIYWADETSANPPYLTFKESS